MKLAIINFAECMNRSNMKIRPAIILSKQNGYITCMPITQHMAQKHMKTSFLVCVGHIIGYVNLDRVFTIPQKYLVLKKKDLPKHIECAIIKKRKEIPNKKNYHYSK